MVPVERQKMTAIKVPFESVQKTILISSLLGDNTNRANGSDISNFPVNEVNFLSLSSHFTM